MKHFFFLILGILLCAGAFAQNSFNVNLLYHWDDTTIVGSGAFDNVYNEVWGFVQDGNEYAVIGTTDGTHIFAVNDPVNATQVAFIPGRVQGSQVIHRDYHDYNGYLYMVCDEGPSSLQIADLSHLPDSAPLVYDDASIIQRSHNIFIDPSSARLFACGSGYQLKVLSLNDPENPVELLNCNSGVDFWPAEIGYCHDVFVKNDTAYLNAPDIPGMFIVDFNDILNVQMIGSLTSYPEQGYNHSGWLHESGDYYALIDETHGTRIKMLDIKDFMDIEVVSIFGSNVDPVSIVHNAIFDEENLFVSHYYDGFYIFNLNDPTDPLITGYYDTSTLPHDSTYQGAWGVYPLLPSGIVVVSDMQNGLYLFDVSQAVGTPELSSTLPGLEVFPNPFKEAFQVNLPDNVQQANYRLLDVAGRTIREGLITRADGKVEVERELSPGVYFLNMNSGNFVSTTSMVKTP